MGLVPYLWAYQPGLDIDLGIYETHMFTCGGWCLLGFDLYNYIGWRKWTDLRYWGWVKHQTDPKILSYVLIIIIIFNHVELTRKPTFGWSLVSFRVTAPPTSCISISPNLIRRVEALNNWNNLCGGISCFNFFFFWVKVLII